MKQVYVMVAVELVTNICYLIPMQDTMAKSLIRSLKILLGLWGWLSTIIVDETKSHQVLARTPDTALADLLMGNTTPLLAWAGISIIVAAGKHHKTVRRRELVIKKIKRLRVSILGLFNFSNVWDFSYQILLVSYYLDERSLFWSHF